MFFRRHFHFLKHVFLHSITAFGGPQNHLLQMRKRFCEKYNYLSEEELMELNAFCNILPGPTSTQILSAIGFKRGKLPLAVLTLIIWLLPPTVLFTSLVMMLRYFTNHGLSVSFFKYLQPMALGFLAFAGYKMIRTVITTGNAIIILMITLLTTFFIQSPFTFPIIFLMSVIISNFRHDDLPPYKFNLKLKWGNIVLFIGLALAAALMGAYTTSYHTNWHKPIVLFENFYRFGALTFGGGQLLVPVMYEQFVLHKHYMTSEAYLTGVGLVQALPGPVFSIAVYTGGIAMQDMGKLSQLLGCLVGMVGIFLPGFLLLIFLFPVWSELRNYPFIKRGLAGINAATVGFIIAASILMYHKLEFDWANVLVIALVFIALLSEKIPAPFIALACLIAGFVFV
ncbi:MAG: chromate efflux transporter [Bacteroidota bacterium]|jgi:chromate transporter